jgi:hypothetical protein
MRMLQQQAALQLVHLPDVAKPPPAAHNHASSAALQCLSWWEAQLACTTALHGQPD